MTIKDLEYKIRNQRRHIAELNDTLREKNLALDALHYVWCRGGCPGGVHRYSAAPLTEQHVLLAERNTLRLRRWWNNARVPPPPMSLWQRIKDAWRILRGN